MFHWLPYEYSEQWEVEPVKYFVAVMGDSCISSLKGPSARPTRPQRDLLR